MSTDEFTKLFKYMPERFDKVDKAFTAKADAVDMKKVLILLDKLTGQQELDGTERLMMGHQLDRLNRWVQELADKIDYKLTA